MARVAPYGPDHACGSEERMDEINAKYLASPNESGSEEPDRAVTIILKESGTWMMSVTTGSQLGPAAGRSYFCLVVISPD